MESILPATTTSSISYLMKNYTEYNLWANITLINWLRAQPAEMLEKEVLSSFPDIKRTLLHIWQTQVYWLSVIKKEPLESPAVFEGNMEEVFTLLIDQSAEISDYVATMTSSQIEDTTLVVSPWFQCDFQNFEYILHLMNHSTYHRGQIITMSHHLGFTNAPMTDYNFYNVMGK